MDGIQKVKTLEKCRGVCFSKNEYIGDGTCSWDGYGSKECEF